MSDPEDRSPAVSYVMPVLNEERHLAEAVGAVLAQEYAGDQELILALGACTDATPAIAARLAAADARVRIVANPESHISAGLNRAIAAARHPVIVRVDAHATLPPGYTATLVSALRRTGAAVVGGLMEAHGDSPLQRSAARAYNSPFGLGGGAYHGTDREGEAESAYLGVFRRDALAAVGGYDETLLRGEDWELAFRLRAAGYRVWLVPSVRVGYWPRDTFGRLARQFFATGAWRAELVRRQRRTSLRYLAPPLLVLGLALSPAAAAALRWGRPRGPARGVLAAAASVPVAYAVGLALVVRRMGGATPADRARDAAVLATLHTSWGLGFLRGLAVGARGTVDRSRVR
nr:glycosyltransferase family 2 protein [Propionibacterium sp.]